jgi:hypothetical protein
MAADMIRTEQIEAFRKRFSRNPILYVTREGAQPEEKLRGMLIGNVGVDSLLIGGFQGIRLEPGEPLVVRTMLDSQVVGFETKVLSAIDDPRAYFVSFPSDAAFLNLRKADRIQAFFPADVSTKARATDGTLLVKARVVDISAGGCSFRSKTRLQNEAEVRMSFMLPGERQVQAGQGVVLESKPLGAVFHNRTTFPRDLGNAPLIRDVETWITENLPYAAVG